MPTGPRTARRRRPAEQRLRCERKLQSAFPRGRHYTLDTFPADDDAGQAALHAARDWIESGNASRFYVYGPPGTGKTGLAYSIAHELSQRYPWEAEPNWINVRLFLAEARARMSRGERFVLDDHDVMAPWGTLILDDLGAERVTDWALDTVAQIVERHYDENDVSIIVTSNYSPSELAARLGRDDPVAGERIVSRLIPGGRKGQARPRRSSAQDSTCGW